MRASTRTMLAGGLLLAGACGDDASVPPLPLLAIERELPPDSDPDESPEPGGYRVSEVDEIGTVIGRVRFRGVRPRLAPFDVPRQDDVCGHSQPNPVFVVGPAGGFADVVVWIDVDEGVAPAAPVEPPVVDQVGCRYVPHVTIVHRGERLLFRNSDAVLHNVHAEWDDGASWFNIGQPRQGDGAIQAPQRIGVARLVCDAGHPWTLGWVHVFDHPYHAITDAEGAFRIEGVPAGSHRVRLWHAGFDHLGQASGRPIFGEPLTEEAQVTVMTETETEMTLVLAAPAKDG